MNSIPMDQRVTSLERRAFLLRLVCILQLTLIVALWLSGPHRGTQVQARSSPQVMRVRELIIEDSQGRPRILLGAPFPAVKERERQDARTTSMLFLDEQGHDRLTVGEELEPQIGGKVPIGLHRIASGVGVVIHDGSGDERGTFAWLSNGRGLVTLDRPGAEAFAAIVNDKTGETKLSLSFPPEVTGDKSAIDIGTKGPASFLRFNSKSGKDRAVFSTESGGKPSFRVFDDLGRPMGERLGP
jgi:hypothetical protein